MIFFHGFWELPRAPAPLCDHGLLRQRVNVRTTATATATTTTTTTITTTATTTTTTTTTTTIIVVDKLLRGCLVRGVVVFWWMRWRDVGFSSLHERHISLDLSYDTAALLFWRVLHFLLWYFHRTTLHIVGWQA